MKKIFKIAGIVVGIIIILLVAAMVIVPLVVDPNDYKGHIVAMVEKETGRKLTIQGDISLSVFPWLGLKTGAVELGSGPGFESPLFAKMESLQIRVRLLPLISKKLEADVVRVQGLVVNLERNKEGRTNWSDLVKAEPEKEPGQGQRGATAAGALAVGGVDIRNAAVTWTDRVSGQRLALRHVTLKTSAVTLVDPVEAKVGFDLDTGDMGIKGKVSSTADITLDLKRQVYDLEILQLAADLKGKGLPGGGAVLKGTGRVAYDAGARTLELKGLKFEAGGLSLPPYTGALVVETTGRGDLGAQIVDLPSLKMEATMIHGKDRARVNLTGKSRVDLKGQKITVSDLALSLPEFTSKGTQVQLSAPGRARVVLDLASMKLTLDELNISGTVKDQALPGGSMSLALGLGARADMNRKTVSIEPLQIEAFGIRLGGELSLAQSKDGAKDAAEIKGNLSIARFNLKEFFSRVMKQPPKVTGPGALSSASLSLSFTASPDRVTVDKFTAAIDETRLKGSAFVKNFSRPDVGFDLDLDRLHLDPYLPPGSVSGPVPAAAAPAAGPAAAAKLPFDSLRKLSLDGTLRVSELVASGMKMADVSVGIRARDGVIRTDPVKAALYGGAFNGAVVLDVRSQEPGIRFEERFTRMRFDRMLKDMGIKTEIAPITGSTNLSLKGSLASDPALQRLRFEKLLVEGNLGEKWPITLSADGTHLNLKDQTLTTELLTLGLKEMSLRMKAKVTDLDKKPRFTTDITVPTFNLRQALARFSRKAPDTSDPKALTSVELTAAVNGSPDALNVESMEIRMDETRLEGKVGVRMKPSQAYRFDLRADALDLDRYMPPPKKGGKPAAGTPGAAASSLPSSARLKSLEMDGQLLVGRLKASNVRLQDIQVTVKGKDGLITLNPLRASLYEGTYMGNIAVDARGKQLRLNLDEKLSDVRVGPLLKDFQGRALLTGIMGLGIKMTAQGDNADAVTRTLNGTMDFQVKDGSIEGMDILGKICRSLSAVKAGSFRKEDLIAGALEMATRQVGGGEQKSENRTQFSELGGSMAFTNGIGMNKDLIVKSPFLRIEGAGSLDLPRRRLDYKATAALVKSCQGQGGRSFKELENYPIPVTITGPLDNLDIKPNLTAGILQILGPRIERKAAQSPEKEAPQILKDLIEPQPKEPDQTPQPQESPKKQREEAIKNLLQRGLQDLLRKR